MNLNKRVASFTLTEVLVTMAISAIVLGLAFSIINYFSKNLQNISYNYSKSINFRLLEEQLILDFNKYHKINIVNNKLSLKTPLDSITYSFFKDHIVRKNDTINITYNNVLFFFKGVEIKNGMVDALKINVDATYNSNIFVYKINDAYTYLKHYGN
jgi:prepilin-type N-terminal cleavage/methylation domain-containing protein